MKVKNPNFNLLSISFQLVFNWFELISIYFHTTRRLGRLLSALTWLEHVLIAIPMKLMGKSIAFVANMFETKQIHWLWGCEAGFILLGEMQVLLVKSTV